MSLDPAAVAAYVERALDAREAQGLPRHLEDETVAELIARIVVSAPKTTPAPPKRGQRQSRSALTDEERHAR